MTALGFVRFIVVREGVEVVEICVGHRCRVKEVICFRCSFREMVKYQTVALMTFSLIFTSRF